ncbi:peptidylprolyl isomerase [Balneolales bacterium ANBcel1]|nr:peptidylprolyl isomerase [Balneolales bacterium ANBcel1]
MATAGTALAQQQKRIADQIVAVVNNHIILKSDVDQRMFEFMQQQQIREFDEAIWYHVLESMIDNYVLVEKGRIDSVVVSDAEVERQLDDRIQQLVRQVGSERELERAFGQPIVEIKAEYADEFRREMLVNRVRQSRLERINITRPEVVEFFESIPTDSLPVIPESVALSQITAIPPPKPDARENARRLAEQLRDSLINHGASMEELAMRHSDGPTASRGGGLPMVSTSDLLPEYAAAAAALEPGEISEVVNTREGLHIIRLNERSGQNISTHHILITVDEVELDEEFAIEKLTAIRDSVMHHDRSFAEMARKHSEDPNTAPAGGRLMNPRTGQRSIPVNELDASLYRLVMLLDEVGDISPPRSYRYGEEERTAYRIVKLNNRIEEHRANLEQDYSLIRSFALQNKQQRVMEEWMDRLRNEMYVEYRISVPDTDLDMDLTPPIPESPEDIPDDQPVQQPMPQQPPP